MSTYKFHRRGDVLTAIPIDEAHPDTCGFFGILTDGKLVGAWPCSAGEVSIDTYQHRVNTWEFYSGFDGTYHRINLHDLEVYDLPVPDGPAIEEPGWNHSTHNHP